MPGDMRELVDLHQVEHALRLWTVLFPPACLAIGVAIAALRRSGLGPVLKAALLALIGPLTWVLWRFYSHQVRYDPETGYFGLDKLRVLAVNALVFVAVGVIYGALVGWFWGRAVKAPPEGGSPETEKTTTG
jgi:chromate transport protein ChrA